MITTILFDLGNVLLHFNHGVFVARLIRRGIDANTFLSAKHSIWALVEKFESGLFDAKEFYRRFLTTVDSDESKIRYDDFVTDWSDIFWRNDAMIHLAERLHPRYRLILVSNTNELHVAHAESIFPEAIELFSLRIYSHRVGAMKPSKIMFDGAMAPYGATPAECLFIDDLYRYVEAARRLGLRAIQHVGSDATISALRLHGIEL